MKEYYIEVIQGRLMRHFTRNFSRIPNESFTMGDGLFNWQCHRNAAYRVLTGKAQKSILVYHIDKDDFGTLHVINQLEDGKFQDNSLGHEALQTTYFFIKEVPYDQLHRAAHWFDDHRKDFVRMNCSRFLIWLFRIKVQEDIF